jgi:hypothetical protein
MKSDVDAFVKAKFSKGGMIDDFALAVHVFEDNPINVFDNGQIAVVGYIAAKYCNAFNDSLKEFLRQMAEDYQDANKFHKTMRQVFNITPYMKGDTMHFRKQTGAVC